MSEAHGPFRSVRSRAPFGGGYLAHVRAGVWEQLTAATVTLLQEAAERIRRGDHRFDHQTAPSWWGRGTHRVLGKDVLMPEEDTVTDALVRSAKLLVDDLDPDDPIRSLHLYFSQQQPRPNDHLGSRSCPTDIQVASTAYNYLDLRMEAKRFLAGRDVAAYSGGDGILRFADPIPYTDKPLGMMVGYSFRHPEAHWHQGIASKCALHTIVGDFETVTAGDHRLRSCLVQRTPALGGVLVVHLILQFDTDPSARRLDLNKAAA